MANDTYPTDPAISTPTTSTALDVTNYTVLVDNIEAIADDLIGAVSDTQDFAGTDHTADQCTDIQDALESIRHMLAHMSGKTNWYDEPETTLEVLYDRLEDLHPPYPGYIETTSLRGAAASGSNTITVTTGELVASNIGRHYIMGDSDETSLQSTYIAVKFTIPDIFASFDDGDAIQIDFITESNLAINCHVDVYIYKSGVAGAEWVGSSTDNMSTTWSTIGFDNIDITDVMVPVAWSRGDIMEIYIKLESRNNYNVKIGKIRFNYTA